MYVLVTQEDLESNLVTKKEFEIIKSQINGELANKITQSEADSFMKNALAKKEANARENNASAKKWDEIKKWAKTIEDKFDQDLVDKDYYENNYKPLLKE